MSRHAAFRTLIRFTMRPLAHPRVPLGLQRRLTELARFTMLEHPGLALTETTLGGRPARRLDVPEALPGRHLLYLHGGAYVLGSPRSHTPIVARVAAQARATGWLPDYRLAPEHPCPAAIEDAVAAYRELLAAGADPAQLVIAGDSAGGGLTLATACALRDAGLPLPSALVLLSPWTDLTLSSEAVRAKQDVEAMLDVNGLTRAAEAYCAGRPRNDPAASPLFADLAGLPPMLVHAGSDEILLDDSEQLAARARAAGVEVTLRVFDGLWHVFQAQAGVIPEADESLADIGDFLARISAR